MPHHFHAGGELEFWHSKTVESRKVVESLLAEKATHPVPNVA
jgi:hypothetical protein